MRTTFICSTHTALGLPDLLTGTLPVLAVIRADELGYPSPPEAREAQALYRVLLSEREAAFTTWLASQQAQASACARQVAEMISVPAEPHDPGTVWLAGAWRRPDPGKVARLLRVAPGMGAYFAQLGDDEWGSCVKRIDGLVEDDGPKVVVLIRSSFGGGDGWFGPPGDRSHRCVFSCGGEGWTRPHTEDDDRLCSLIRAAWTKIERFSAGRRRSVEHALFQAHLLDEQVMAEERRGARGAATDDAAMQCWRASAGRAEALRGQRARWVAIAEKWAAQTLPSAPPIDIFRGRRTWAPRLVPQATDPRLRALLQVAV